MTPPAAMAIPVTIVTGFLGAGKTTMILSLIPQLPRSYRVAILKNEFGDVAIDSQLAGSQSVAGVQELLNGCICCNLVGQLGDALETLRRGEADGRGPPDRIIIETSGSAFPATLAMEVNRLADTTGGKYVLDGVVSVIDVENWKGYEDTSFTAKLQARYTDLVVLNKWEDVGERRLDECLDRLGDIDVDIASVKSDKGKVDKDVILGLDGALAREIGVDEHTNGDAHDHHHQNEVEVLSISANDEATVDVDQLDRWLRTAPKEEIYRIKAVLKTSKAPISQDAGPLDNNGAATYILNWAFARWTFTPISLPEPPAQGLRMTVILARDEANKWKKRLEETGVIKLDAGNHELKVKRML